MLQPYVARKETKEINNIKPIKKFHFKARGKHNKLRLVQLFTKNKSMTINMFMSHEVE